MISVTIPRTVSQIPEHLAARVTAPKLPRLGRLGRMFPIARDIVEASSHARRAAILLRLTDAIVLSHGDVIAAACRQSSFSMGVMFIGQRSAVLHASRLPDGSLPAHCIHTLEIWRRGMVALSQQQGGE